jgi:hypothetical protein
MLLARANGHPNSMLVARIPTPMVIAVRISTVHLLKKVYFAFDLLSLAVCPARCPVRYLECRPPCRSTR